MGSFLALGGQIPIESGANRIGTELISGPNVLNHRLSNQMTATDRLARMPTFIWRELAQQEQGGC